MAKADRAPVDRLVALIENSVEALRPDEWALTECRTVNMDDKDDWQIVVAREPETALLERVLNERGYTVKDVVKSHRPKTCDCAMPPKNWEGGSYVMCAAYCFDGPRITVCWS